ncbi:hypothetical protein ACWCPQ_24730 [Nocardia sp. NPDC001965]
MLTVLEAGTPIEFSFDDLMKYHGTEFPGGVAHAYCAVRHAVSLLGEIERREIAVRTAFPGPGGRDAVEMVLRAVTGDRFTVDPELADTARGPVLARYVWEFTHGERVVTLRLRDAGFVTGEFIELGARRDRGPAENARLTVLKQEMTDRLLAGAVGEVYEEIPTPTR